MKPLQTIAGMGDATESVIAHLINVANYAFADLAFAYKDTIVSYEQSGHMQLAAPKLICKVTLIFEADSQEDIEKFTRKVYDDPQLRGLLPPPANHLQAVPKI